MDSGSDGKAWRRLNAIHLLLLGADYQVVLRNNRVNERTFRMWIAHFNEQGVDALIYKPYPGMCKLLYVVSFPPTRLPARSCRWLPIRL